MTSGTKILLAASALFVGVLVLYYGFIMSGDDDATELAIVDPSSENEPASEPVSAKPEPRIEVPMAIPVPVAQDTVAADREDEDQGVRAIEQRQTNRPTGFSNRVFTMLDNPMMPRPAAASKGDVTTEPIVEKEIEVTTPRANLPATTVVRDPVREQTPPPTDVKPEPPAARTAYTIRSGDTLTAIAARWFGDAQKWDLIMRENPSLDPKRLRIGQTIQLPMPDTKRPRPALGNVSTNGAKSYVVRAGDSLSSIARAFYDDESEWRVIWNANRGAIGGSPDDLEVGMLLTIPAR